MNTCTVLVTVIDEIVIFHLPLIVQPHGTFQTKEQTHQRVMTMMR